MTTPPGECIRPATVGDAERLIRLWALVYDEHDSAVHESWRNHAREWVTHVVGAHAVAWLPVIEVDGDIVATAVGTLEIGVPNPHCPRGRTVRLANVITMPEQRGKGYGTRLVRDVIKWAVSIGADRVDLSATPDGQRIYEKARFIMTTAPRMKLVL